MIKNIEVCCKIGCLYTIDIISYTNFNLVKIADGIQMIYRERCKSIDTLCILKCYKI